MNCWEDLLSSIYYDPERSKHICVMRVYRNTLSYSSNPKGVILMCNDK
nr:MAG TPA: hypothetical protein [Caudoviricetes sp.]